MPARLARLLLLASPLLLSCEDESSLGFRSPDRKFTLHYAEIPVQTGMIAFDSISTENFYDGTTNRLLAGGYNDPALGQVSAVAYAQFVPSTTTIAFLPSAQFDSVALELKWDLYRYGTGFGEFQSYAIYELTEQLVDTITYYNTSGIAYDPNPIGTGTVFVDTLTDFHVRLNDDFGLLLYDLATVGDSTFTSYKYFRESFKGIAMGPAGGDLVIGISPTASKLVLYYHDGTQDSLSYAFNLTRKSFTGFQVDRSATPLAGITAYRQAYPPIDDLCYTQSGTSLQGIVDLSGLFDGPNSFFDTIPKMLINSAELVIMPEAENGYDKPQSFVLRLLSSADTYMQRTNDVITQIGAYYPASLLAPLTTNNLPIRPYNSVIVGGDFFLPSQYHPLYVSLINDEYYSGFMTQYLQALYEADSANRLYRFAISPYPPDLGKSVNRFAFNKSAIKLKVYYTVPTVATAE